MFNVKPPSTAHAMKAKGGHICPLLKGEAVSALRDNFCGGIHLAGADIRKIRSWRMGWIGRIVTVAGLAAAGAGVWTWLNQGTPVVVQPVKRGTAAEVVYGTGAVEPVEWAKVIPPVRARIESHCRCEGKAVKAGDVLMTLDEKAPRAELAQLDARRNFLTHELDRQRSLIARGSASLQAYERAQSELGQVEAQIAAATARLSDYTVRAPIDGVILRADGQVGEIAGTTEPLF